MARLHASGAVVAQSLRGALEASLTSVHAQNKLLSVLPTRAKDGVYALLSLSLHSDCIVYSSSRVSRSDDVMSTSEKWRARFDSGTCLVSLSK